MHPSQPRDRRSGIHVVVVGEFPRPGQAVLGGPANGTVRLVEGLATAGVDVTVVAPLEEGAEEPSEPMRQAKVVWIRHSSRLSLLRGMRPWRVPAVHVISELDADVVHGQGILTGGLVAANADGLPRVVTARGNARLDTLHAYPGLAGRIRAGARSRLAGGVVRAVDAVVNVHPDWRVNLPVEPRRSTYIPNIVDEAFFSPTANRSTSTVLYCGGPRLIKGWDLLATAYANIRKLVRNVELRIVGWPAMLPRPELPGVRVSDALSPSELATVMGESSLVAIPSRYEVAPIVLAEAWAVGTPVVTTSAGGLATLAPGAAIVVEPNSPELLERAMLSVLRHEVDTTAMVRQGQERASKHRSAAVVAAHLHLYAELAPRAR